MEIHAKFGGISSRRGVKVLAENLLCDNNIADFWDMENQNAIYEWPMRRIKDLSWEKDGSGRVSHKIESELFVRWNDRENNTTSISLLVAVSPELLKFKENFKEPEKIKIILTLDMESYPMDSFPSAKVIELSANFLDSASIYTKLSIKAQIREKLRGSILRCTGSNALLCFPSRCGEKIRSEVVSLKAPRTRNDKTMMCTVTSDTIIYFADEALPRWIRDSSPENFLLDVRDAGVVTALRGFLQSAAQGKAPGAGGCLLVTGPAGVGKSSLVFGLGEDLRHNAGIDTQVFCLQGSVEPRSTALRSLRQRLALARAAAPAVLLLDRIDILLRHDAACGAELAHWMRRQQAKRAEDRESLVIVGTTELVGSLQSTLLPTDTLHLRERLSLSQRTALVSSLIAAESGKDGTFYRPLSPSRRKFIEDDIAGLPLVPAAARCRHLLREMSALASPPDSFVGLPTDGTQVEEEEKAEREMKGGGAEQGAADMIQIYGHKDIRTALEELLRLPRRYTHLLKAVGLRPPAGLLLFGPPGTGKTLLARAEACRAGAAFVVLQMTAVVRGEVGTGEAAVHAAFAEARRVAPSVIFVDEFQAAFGARGATGGNALLTSAMASCLDELSGWNDQPDVPAVSLLAATNEPWAIDAGFLRAGRFDRALYVGPLDEDGRNEFLRANLSSASTTEEYKKLVHITEGLTGADLVLLRQRAALVALSRSLDCDIVTRDDTSTTNTLPNVRTEDWLTAASSLPACSTLARSQSTLLHEEHQRWAAKNAVLTRF